MFFRTKKSGIRSYLQVVENRWEDGRPRQRVIATLGRLDQLQQTGQLDALLVSGARLAQSVLLLSAHAKGQLPTITTRRIGPALIFGAALASDRLPTRRRATPGGAPLRVRRRASHLPHRPASPLRPQ